MSDAEQDSMIWPSYAAILLLCFAVGWGGNFVFSHRDSILDVFIESHENKYLVMSGGSGPTTFLVMHDGQLEKLEKMAALDPDILGVEQDQMGTVAKIAFTSVHSPSIEKVKSLDGVTEMINRNVPMLCH